MVLKLWNWATHSYAAEHLLSGRIAKAAQPKCDNMPRFSRILPRQFKFVVVKVWNLCEWQTESKGLWDRLAEEKRKGERGCLFSVSLQKQLQWPLLGTGVRELLTGFSCGGQDLRYFSHPRSAAFSGTLTRSWMGNERARDIGWLPQRLNLPAPLPVPTKGNF